MREIEINTAEVQIPTECCLREVQIWWGKWIEATIPMDEWRWIQVTPWGVIAWCDKCGDDSGPRILQEEKRYK